jgi:hypothetical protein
MKQLFSILLMLTLGAPSLWAQDKHSETYIRERIDAIYDNYVHWTNEDGIDYPVFFEDADSAYCSTGYNALYTQFLGKTPHGTAAMMPMAMEIYGRDREEGLRCIKLICYPSNVNSVVSQLNQKFGTSQYAPANDGYHQRYLPAAVLKGATPENGYTPPAALHGGDEGQREQAPGTDVFGFGHCDVYLHDGQGLGH